MSPLDTLLDDLVAANRILAGLGVLDGFGHVSVRHPRSAGPLSSCRARSRRSSSRATTSRRTTSRPPCRTATRAQPYLERFIHGEIYAQAARRAVGGAQPRRDGRAVRHDAMRRCGRSSTCRASCARAHRCSRCASASATPTCSCATTRRAQRSPTRSTGAVVLMRGHGYCTVGGTIAEAVFRAYYTQVNAELQQRAIALGGDDVTYLTEDEAKLSEESNRSRHGAAVGIVESEVRTRRNNGARNEKGQPHCPVCRRTAGGHAARSRKTYPTKPIRLIVPFSPGGAADLTARTLGEKMGESWGSRSSSTTSRAPMASSASTSPRRRRPTATRCCSPIAARSRSIRACT